MSSRFATRRELVGLLAEDDLDLTDVRAVVDRLADLGVEVEQLVTITEEIQADGYSTAVTGWGPRT